VNTQVVFVYADKSLHESVEILRDYYPVCYYPDDPQQGTGEVSVWIVKEKEDRNAWPLEGRDGLRVFYVGQVSSEALLFHVNILLTMCELA
jgi:hypothetical protein